MDSIPAPVEYTFDPRTLREVPKDPDYLQIQVENLQSSLNGIKDPEKRMRLLGEVGVRLRTLGQLSEAEDALSDALHIAQTHNLGIRCEVQQKIRLAHVWHWQGEFGRADRMLRQVRAACEAVDEVKDYLPFAIQHAGKCYFDQGRFADARDAFSAALKLRRKAASPADQIESSELALREAERRLEGATGMPK